MEGARILNLCEKGDQLLDDEVSKVYKGKKITKGMWLSGETLRFLSDWLYALTWFNELFFGDKESPIQQQYLRAHL